MALDYNDPTDRKYGNFSTMADVMGKKNTTSSKTITPKPITTPTRGVISKSSNIGGKKIKPSTMKNNKSLKYDKKRGTKQNKGK